jgi:sortase A
MGDVSAPSEEVDESVPDAVASAVAEPDVADAEGKDPEATQPTNREVRGAGPPKLGKLVILLSVVLFAGIVTAFLGVFVYGLSGLQEHRSQQQLYAQFRGLLAPASTTAPSTGGTIPPGTPVALLNASQAGIHNVMVVEGTSSGALLKGPGHLPSTPLPGQGGEAVLVGKSTTAGAPFADVSRLRRGDVVTVRTGQGLFHFSVQGRLPPGARQGAIPSDRGRLVLVTSGGSGGTGGLEPSHTLDVLATLKGKAVTAPPHRPHSVARADVPGQTDPGAWPFVALWLAGLAIATALVWWLWDRWGILRAWIVGAPVLLALLWGLSNEAMRLLPNVY